MWSKSAIAILLNLLLLLGYFNWSALQKEETLAKGRLVLLELVPVAPRSLMQKNYMRHQPGARPGKAASQRLRGGAGK
jgi:uncharacterized membrane-anchored protein